MQDIRDLAQGLSQSADARRAVNQELTQSRANADKIANAIGKVKFEMPEGFKLDWGISIHGLKELLMGLDLTMDQIQKLTGELPAIVRKLDEQSSKQSSELRDLISAVEQIKAPEVIVPEMPTELKITDQDKIIKLLTKLVNKPDFEKTNITMPDFPSSLSVNNLDILVEKLEALQRPEAQEETEPTGYYFKRDANDQLESITEFYPNGNVISKGWNIGRVEILDERV